MIHGQEERWYQSDRFIAISLLLICAGCFYELTTLAAWIIGGYL